MADSPKAFDILILGGGSAGYAAALRAVQLGDDVALGLGVRLGVNRAVLLIASVLLASAAVAAVRAGRGLDELDGPLARGQAHRRD